MCGKRQEEEEVGRYTFSRYALRLEAWKLKGSVKCQPRQLFFFLLLSPFGWWTFSGVKLENGIFMLVAAVTTVRVGASCAAGDIVIIGKWMNNKIIFLHPLYSYDLHELRHDPQILSSCFHIENSSFFVRFSHLKNKFHCLMRKILCVCLAAYVLVCKSVCAGGWGMSNDARIPLKRSSSAISETGWDGNQGVGWDSVALSS